LEISLRRVTNVVVGVEKLVLHFLATAPKASAKRSGLCVRSWLYANHGRFAQGLLLYMRWFLLHGPELLYRAVGLL
jgi:hypothetical protein